MLWFKTDLVVTGLFDIQYIDHTIVLCVLNTGHRSFLGLFDGMEMNVMSSNIVIIDRYVVPPHLWFFM